MIHLNEAQLTALIREAAKSPLGSVSVGAIPRLGYDGQALDAIQFAVQEPDGRTEGIMDEAGEVVA